MKPFEVTVTVRNNRLKARRKALGFTIAEIALASGMSAQAYGRLETLRKAAVSASGEWAPTALAIADYLDVPPSELFPDCILAVKTPVTTRLIDAAEAAALAGGSRRMALPADEKAEDADLDGIVDRALGSLSKREEQSLRRHYGIDCESHTYEQVGAADANSVSAKRARQIVAKGLRKLRRSAGLRFALRGKAHGSQGSD